MLPRAPVSNWIDPRDIKASLGASIQDQTFSNHLVILADLFVLTLHNLCIYFSSFKKL